MNIKFVPDSEVPPVEVNYTKLEPLLAELKNHKSKWAELPRKYSNTANLYVWRKKYPEYEFSAKKLDTTSNRCWVMYVRFVGDN